MSSIISYTIRSEPNPINWTAAPANQQFMTGSRHRADDLIALVNLAFVFKQANSAGSLSSGDIRCHFMCHGSRTTKLLKKGFAFARPISTLMVHSGANTVQLRRSIQQAVVIFCLQRRTFRQPGGTLVAKFGYFFLDLFPLCQQQLTLLFQTPFKNVRPLR